MCLISTPLYLCQPTGQPANGQLKSRTKNIFFCKKNAVGHATFAGQTDRDGWAYHTCINLFIFVSNNPVVMS